MGSVIVGYARTPIGRYLGALADLPAATLGGHAIRAALDRSGIPAEAIDQVVMGHVLQAGTGQLTARQAAVAAGLAMDVPALTIDKVCLSGLAAIHHADLLVRSGERTAVVAGGMESMSQAPHLLPGARRGLKYGSAEVVDSLERDGLWDVYTDQSMGVLAERDNAIGRRAQDEFAARSHQRAAAAEQILAEEIVPVPVRRGEVSVDEGIRPDSTPESLGGLRPAFSAAGTITAGSASQMSDGAAAVVATSAEQAREWGVRPLAEIAAYGQVAGPDSSLRHQPAAAIQAAAQRLGLPADGFDRYEINEAFAAVVLASTEALGLGADEVDERVNVHGGAIALGHPLGASGARIVGHLAVELQRRGSGIGVAAACGGGGQGDAIVLRAIAS